MKFLLDKSKVTIDKKLSAHHDYVLGQLLTPLTGYANHGGIYAIDNGAFSGFNENAFKQLLKRNENSMDKCLFVSCPDIVGSAQRTIELFNRRHLWIPDGWKVALVAQDGVESCEIPWDELDAIFIGGGDPWKDSSAAHDVVRTAKILGKWVHVGRVNTHKRFSNFAKLGADSCDGSGASMYDHMLESIISSERGENNATLFNCAVDE